MKCFIFGFGQVCKLLAQELYKQKCEIIIVSRESQQYLGLSFKKISFFNDNNLDFSNSILISTIPPIQKNKDFIIENVPNTVLKKFKRIVYISSTSVYQSGYVDETTKPKPLTEMGINRLNIEKKWQKINKDLVIIRPSGIYSNTNNLLTRYLKSDHKIIVKEDHFTNRIHIDDLVGIILKIISIKKFIGIINASDSYFLDNFKLINQLSGKYFLPKPQKISYNKKIISKKLQSFYEVSKKVYSKRLNKELSYSLKYPKFDDFLDSLLRKNNNE